MQRIKQRWAASLLCAFVISFTLLIFGLIDIFVGNQEEFTFAVSDFIWPMILIGLGLTAVLFAVLVLVPDKAYPAAFGLLCGLALMCVLQSLFLNSGASSLPSGDMISQIGIPLIIIDTLLWIAVPAFCIFAAYKIKWAEWYRTISLVLLVVIGGMSVVGTISDVFTLSSRSSGNNGEPVVGGVNYLSTDGLREVAPESNVIVFILDRFDIQYHDNVEASDPGFFAPLTGFTYFSDNVSYFSATYPSIVHLVTGTKQDFSRSANDYFNAAYDESSFLGDLHDNDYAIRVYTGSYYAYRDATSMTKYIENAAVTGHYIVTNRGALLRQMIVLSAYRYAPSAAKLLFPESWFNFEVVTDVEDNGESVYTLDDVKFHETMADGLTIQDSDHKNAYIFYHLTGCHPPLYMDENCERVERASVVQSAKGCFKIIYEYIDELKRLGLYEQATIVITGDHSAGFSDVEGAAPVNGTALFVKPSGKSGEPLAVSTAQVSDDNMIPAIIKSAGIRSSEDYGAGYFDIPEGEDTVRYMVRFEEAKRGIHFTITGPWVGKDNWEVTEREEFSDFYR
ncbi:MAG: hypothetical protein MJ192_08155 [Clostridia bacterium]|nr:hypothetical protein [Clostridia bacterium]